MQGYKQPTYDATSHSPAYAFIYREDAHNDYFACKIDALLISTATAHKQKSAHKEEMHIGRMHMKEMNHDHGLRLFVWEIPSSAPIGWTI